MSATGDLTPAAGNALPFELPPPLAALVEERPEALLGIAFAAGFLAAQTLKFLAK